MFTEFLDFFTKPFLYWKKTMLTRDFSCQSKKGFLSLEEGKVLQLLQGKFFPCWEMFYFPKGAIQENELSKILEEEYPGKLLPANINTN
jgi:hypothetical protein